MSNEFKPAVLGFPEGGYEGVEGKIIQLYIAKKADNEPDIPIMLFGIGKHGEVLQQYLDSMDFEYDLFNAPYSIGKQFPTSKGSQYEVVGMGGFKTYKRSDEALLLLMNTGSMDYEFRGFYDAHSRHIEKLDIMPKGWDAVGW